jgi:signal transduction histidine kinase
VYQPVTQSDGTVAGVLIHAVDVTQQVHSRREIEGTAIELARTTVKLETTNRELERSNRDLDQFAYIASHDLKAPLRGIANLASWIEEDLEDVPGEVRENIHLLRDRVQRMEDLIGGLLEYSRAGRVRGSIEEISPLEVIEDVIDFVDVPDKIECAIDADVPTFRGERLPLRQVLQNLVANAAKHASARLAVSVEREGDVYRFSVSDDGPGIAPEYHERIWTIFQTLESRDEGGGTGIGLSIVKKIIEDQGGDVSLESEGGGGTVFRFSWPALPTRHREMQ